LKLVHPPTQLCIDLASTFTKNTLMTYQTNFVGTKTDIKIIKVAARCIDLNIFCTESDEIEKPRMTTAESEIVGMAEILKFFGEKASSEVATFFRFSHVDHWIDFSLYEMRNLSQKTSTEQNKVLEILNEHLMRNTFMVGHVLTIADFCVAISLEKISLTFDSNPAVFRFYQTISHQKIYELPKSNTETFIEETSNKPELEALKRVEISGNAAIDKLNELGISNMTYAHEAAMTVEEQLEKISSLDGAKTKNLFLRDKKHGMFLVTAAHDTLTETKSIAALLKLPTSTNLRFADEKYLLEVLGVKQGSVGPLSLINDTENQAKFVLDKKLVDADVVISHPLRNDLSTAMASKDLIFYAEKCNHEPIILDFSAVKKIDDVHEKKVKPEKIKKSSKSDKPKQQEKSVDGGKKDMKKETLLAIDRKKSEDFAGWYKQVITYSEMIDYYDISGCYILRPWAFEIWEKIQRWFDDRIKERGVSNSYFPLFVSKKALEAEQDHVEGFAPEVAWVTKSGETDLIEPIAVRPTSETIMYPAYARWIRSHRDLPLCLNQWSNVVRWEFKDPTPFLRSREFLWQEGHTAHATFEEAEEMVYGILDLYAKIYEELLAVPVIKGIKTQLEKFAGGFRTTTVEAYIAGSGRAIQGATSHNLGQNFGKMFNIKFEDKDGSTKIPWQTSWGITTRSIGVCVMCHGDDLGLVLPPKVAPLQVIIVPVITKKFGLDKLSDYVEKVLAELKRGGIRVKFDSRDNYTAGWKYNHWEQKGVPLRLEIGPRDLEKNQCMAVRRDNAQREDVLVENILSYVEGVLEMIQDNLFKKATAARDEHLSKVLKWEDFVPALNRNDIVLTPFCNEDEWEEKVKVMSREEALSGESEDVRSSTSVAAKTLCIPLDQPELPTGTKCFVSEKPATCWVLWGRSY